MFWNKKKREPRREYCTCGTLGVLWENCPKCNALIHLHPPGTVRPEMPTEPTQCPAPRPPAGGARNCSLPLPPGLREPKSSPPRDMMRSVPTCLQDDVPPIPRVKPPKRKDRILSVSQWSRMIRGYIRFCTSVRSQKQEAKIKELEERISRLESANKQGFCTPGA